MDVRDGLMSDTRQDTSVLAEGPLGDPPGLANGRYAWPAWAIGMVGGGLVALTLIFMAWRLARQVRRRRRSDKGIGARGVAREEVPASRQTL